jgi:Caspase domain
MRNLLFLLLLPSFLFSQNLKLDWEKTLGSDMKIHAIMEASNGYLMAVGETSSKTSGGSDGLLIVADHSTGQLVTTTRYGGNKDDVLRAVVQTFDGRFLLAGSTASIGKGGDDAWLLLVDENGKKIWETSFGTPGRDECLKMLLLPDGTALMAGRQNNARSGDVWLAKIDGQQIVWEKQLGDSEFETLSGLALATDGGVVFSGNTGRKAEKGSGDVYLAKADANGALVWKKWFGESGWEEALNLIATRDGGFAISGLTKSKGAGDLDCWLVKTSRDGFRQWDKAFGGKNADIANAVLQTSDGGFLLAGDSKSQRSGARFTDAYSVQTSPGGDLQWEQYYGKDRDDNFINGCTLHNGSVVFVGNLEGNTTILRFSDPQMLQPALAGIRNVASLNLTEATVHSLDGSTLTPGEHGYLSFQVSNAGDIDLNDLRVNVDNRSGNDLAAWSTNYLGALRQGENVAVRIPLDAIPDFRPGDQQLNITLSSGTKSIKSFDKSVALRKPQPANLLIAGHNFVLSGRSDEVTLKVQVQNSGDASSGAAELRFSLPAGLRAVGATAVPMGVVGAHSRREVSLAFIKTPQFSGSVAAITCTVLENSQQAAQKTFEFQTGSGIQASGPILIWTDPAPHETGTNKVRKSDNQFEFKMTVVSPKPVNTKNIKMKVNGVEMDGSKFNEEDLSPPRMENTRFTYTYRNKIPLQQGSNRVEVMVDDQLSDPLEVEFIPERANLYVLAIGPKHEDLQYTAKDATDFANAFKNQGGPNGLFNEVVVKTMTAPEQTDDKAIKKAMYDLLYQWKDGKIKPNDVLLVFISSHGKIVENRFKILQTGYDPKYEFLTVDYKTDVLEKLSPVTCKKLIFLDACHSGGAKDGFDGLSQAVVELSKIQAGVSTLTSCGSTEKSYEDKLWENGAFTESLLEAFDNKSCTDKEGAFQADKDNDRIIRLGELYEFLRRRVPALVQAGVPNAPTSQTPFMPESELDKNLPLFILDK